jgi:hypothetical protein
LLGRVFFSCRGDIEMIQRRRSEEQKRGDFRRAEAPSGLARETGYSDVDVEPDPEDVVELDPDDEPDPDPEDVVDSEPLSLELPDEALIANIFEVLPAMVPGAHVWVDALELSGSYMVTEPSEFWETMTAQ